MTLNEWAKACYDNAKAHGFHDVNNTPASLCANLHGEVSELWEAFRKGTLNSPCDKASKMSEPLTCAEEELADIIIRALDNAAQWGIDIERAVRIKHEYNVTRPYLHGGKLA